MPSHTRGLKLESLSSELEARGLSVSAARALSDDFVLRHPFAQRLGLQKLIGEIEHRGMASDSAPGAAGLLLGIELRDRGADLDAVISELETLGLDHNDALASALSGARVYREICTESESSDDFGESALRALVVFGVVILFASTWIRLAG